jgi:tol-pal system protein YbgF
MKTRAAFFILSLMLSGVAITALPAHAQLFGESDEEKAARQAHEDGQDSQISQLSSRIQQQEDKVRSLTQSLSNATGANEELAHQIQELRQKIDAQQKDFAYRLCMLSAQQLGAGADDQGLNCSATGSAVPAPAGGVPQNYTPGTPLPPIGSDNQGFNGAPSAGAPQQLGRPPGTLGTLPANGGAGGPRTAIPAGPSAARGGTAQFDSAMNLLAKAQYAEASAAFRAYADGNSDDNDLSPQAIYWIGDIAYVQHDYPGATRAFAEQIKKYPTSNRSPDSMLKLGQALIAQGQTSGGCTTLAALKTKYPNAPAATLAAAAGAHKAASCPKAGR